MLASRSHRSAFAVAAGLLAVVVATPATAAPRRADLAVTATVTPTTMSTAGGTAQLRVQVTNIGDAPAPDPLVTVVAPRGTALAEDPVTAAGWACDTSRPRIWTCAHETLAAGASADLLVFPVAVAAGRDGDRRTVSVAVATSTRESTTRNNLATSTVRLATPVPGDLRVSLTAGPAEVVVGDLVELRIEVHNSGPGPAWAYVDVPLATGLDPAWIGGTDGWDCNFGRDVETDIRSWGCSYYDVDVPPGEGTLPLHLFVIVTSGTPGSTLEFSASARPQDGEPVIEDNIARTTVEVG
jgi:hypothetical protein